MSGNLRLEQDLEEKSVFLVLLLLTVVVIGTKYSIGYGRRVEN